MAKKNATAVPDSIRVSYDLFDLPTAQHKAGLAGLVLLIGSLRERGNPPKSLPEIEELTPTRARFKFSRDSLQTLFDDLYDAKIVKEPVKAKKSRKASKQEEVVERIDPETEKTQKARVQPLGTFLRYLFPDEDGLWLKLWREMLWEIPRGKPLTRKPFERRALGRHCGEADNAWKELVAFERARQHNQFRTEEVAGALLLGAQAVNAEGVPFQGRSDQNLLLHFWQLTVLTFVPQAFNQEGKSRFVGYVLAIPEVSDLVKFRNLFPKMLRGLDTTPRGFRPAAAVIDLPDQGALEFLEHLAELARELVESKELAYAVSAVEFLHMVKIVNNIKTMAAGRVSPRRSLLGDYRAIKTSYRNPLFRSAVLLALVRDRDQPWYAGMDDLFAQYPWPFFIRGEQSPPQLPWFSADVATKFRRLGAEHQETLEAYQMTGPENPKPAADRPRPPLETLVFRLVQTYVWRKTEEKSGIKYEDFKDKKVKDEKGKERMAVPREYQKAREGICSDAFLALRSRREQDFVDYFTGRICSVGQFLPLEDYRVIAEALVDSRRWEDVKTLAMLALSANS